MSVVSVEQPENAKFPIVVTDDGMATVCNLVQFLKADAIIEVTGYSTPSLEYTERILASSISADAPITAATSPLIPYKIPSTIKCENESELPK